jgi:hypothetical protein
VTTVGARSRTSILGAGLVSALVAGPLGGFIVALLSIAGYPSGGLAETPAPMLLIWGPLTGLFAACLPAATFGAAIGLYVQRGVSRGEHALRIRAAVGGSVLGASFGAGTHFISGLGAPLSLLLIAGALSGAFCGAMITSLVCSDDRADVAAAQQ